MTEWAQVKTKNCDYFHVINEKICASGWTQWNIDNHGIYANRKWQKHIQCTLVCDYIKYIKMKSVRERTTYPFVLLAWFGDRNCFYTSVYLIYLWTIVNYSSRLRYVNHIYCIIDCSPFMFTKTYIIPRIAVYLSWSTLKAYRILSVTTMFTQQKRMNRNAIHISRCSH